MHDVFGCYPGLAFGSGWMSQRYHRRLSPRCHRGVVFDSSSGSGVWVRLDEPAMSSLALSAMSSRSGVRVEAHALAMSSLVASLSIRCSWLSIRCSWPSDAVACCPRDLGRGVMLPSVSTCARGRSIVSVAVSMTPRTRSGDVIAPHPPPSRHPIIPARPLGDVIALPRTQGELG